MSLYMYCILFWNQRVYIANNARVKIICIFTMLNFITHMGGKDIYKYLETEDILDFGKLFTKFQSFRSEMSSPQLSFQKHSKICHCCETKEVGGWYIMCIFDLHISKAKYERKVVLLSLWRVNVKTIRGFIDISTQWFLLISSYIKLRHNNITSGTNTVDRPRHHFYLLLPGLLQ
jgi:hypothetical protein